VPILIKLIFLTTVLWGTVYSVSYTVYQLKARRILPALIAALLTVLSAAACILSLFRM